MNWILLWKAVLLFTLVSFSFLFVIVLIGGTRNTIDLFRDLSSTGKDED